MSWVEVNLLVPQMGYILSLWPIRVCLFVQLAVLHFEIFHMDYYNEQWLCEHMCSVSICMSVNGHMGCFTMQFQHFESTWESGTLPLIIVDIVSFTGIQWYLGWDGTLKYFKYFSNNFCLWMIGLSYCEIIGQRLACNTCVSNLFNSFWGYRPRLFSSQLLLQLWINSCVWNIL